MDAVREKLLDLEKQYNEINEKLTDEEVDYIIETFVRVSEEILGTSQK